MESVEIEGWVSGRIPPPQNTKKAGQKCPERTLPSWDRLLSAARLRGELRLITCGCTGLGSRPQLESEVRGYQWISILMHNLIGYSADIQEIEGKPINKIPVG